MAKVVVLEGQSLYDLAIQECGGIEAVFGIAELNGIAITDVLEIGSAIIEAGVIDKLIAGYYTTKDLKPATDGVIRLTAQKPTAAIVVAEAKRTGGFITHEKQSIFDIALIASGSIEAVFDISELNGKSITDALDTGLAIIEAGVIDKLIADYYKDNRLIPATDVYFAYNSGIDYWAVDVDFVVQ